MEAVYGLRWLPRVLARWLSHVLIRVATPRFLFGVGTSEILINNNDDVY